MKKDRNKNAIPVKDAINSYFEALGMSDKMNETRVLSKWNDLMGDAIDKRTEKKYIKGKTLYIELNSSVMRDELQHRKDELIDKINGCAGCQLIDDIYLK